MSEEDKMAVEYIPDAQSDNIVHIVDFGNSFSTAIVTNSEPNGIIDERNGIITVISESQLQEAAAANGTTYEYIPLQPPPLTTTETGHTRDALQAALESAEVDKMEILRTADGTLIYESSDSNSQSHTQVRFSNILQ